MTCIKRWGTIALVATLAAPLASPMASAHMIGTLSSPAAIDRTTNAENVQYRRGYYGRGYGRHGWNRGYRRHYGGAGIAAGIAGLIIGGAIANSQTSYRGRWDQCASTYRSFSWNDGTFQPYGGGPRQLCPYLRR